MKLLPPNVDPSEVVEEFINSRKLKQPEGVVVKSCKDVGVCYAFVDVEFEEFLVFHIAVKVEDTLEKINIIIPAEVYSGITSSWRAFKSFPTINFPPLPDCRDFDLRQVVGSTFFFN